jgi:hypothetical protein
MAVVTGSVTNEVLYPMVRLAGTTPEYEPYNPATDITIPAPDGTIYGGTLDVESGELTVTNGIIDLGSLHWNQQISTDYKYFYNSVPITNPAKNIENSICSQYKYSNDVSLSNPDNYVFKFDSLASTFLIKDTRYSTSSDFKTAVTGQKVCYELATPKTYHLSPHQVKLLTGHNTVTTNGTSLQLTYRKGEIAGLSDLSGLAESVEGIINYFDKNGQLQADVDLTPYSSSSNKYTIPEDGYVQIQSSNGKGLIAFQSSNRGGDRFYIGTTAADSNFYNALFVKKGMLVWVAGIQNGTATYIPIK